MKRHTIIIFAGVILALAFILQTGFLAYAMYALLLLYFSSLVMSIIWLRGVECKREISETEVQIGDEVRVKLTIKNTNAWFIPWIFLEEYKPPQQALKGQTARIHMFWPRQEIEMKYTVRFNKRGYRRLGPLTMETGDIFGLQRRFAVGAARDYVTVFPRVMVIGEYEIGSRKPVGEIKFSHKIYEDPSRISGIREYIPGDSLNRIHWKVSAAKDQLYTKLFEPSVVTGATIALDFHESGYQDPAGEERMELAITTASSIASFVHNTGEQVGYFTNGRDAAERGLQLKKAEVFKNRLAAQSHANLEAESHRLRPFQVPTRKSSLQIFHIMESLARTDMTDGNLFETALESEFRRFRRDATLILIVPHVTSGLLLMIGTLKSVGFNIVVFVIKNQAACDSARERLADLRVPVFGIDGEHNLHALVFENVPI
ncbi:DUF58 domain-containing protein [Candidatus Hydrogenedentota bacterium]